MLNLVDSFVRESNDACLTVGTFAEEITFTLAHDEGRARCLVGGMRDSVDLKWGASEGASGGDDQSKEERCDGGSHGDGEWLYCRMR